MDETWLQKRNREDYNFANGLDNDGIDSVSEGNFWDNMGGMDTALGLGKLGLGALEGVMSYKNYGLAKDTFNYNKMDRDRTYAANKLKYNNQLGRTAAIDRHYGTKSSGTAL